MEKVIEKVDKQVILDGVIIPYCEEGGIEWYPVKYIVEQFLLKGYNRASITDKCEEFVKRKIIDYSFKGTSPQETNCMNKEGWIKYLGKCKLNKNKDENKIKRHNIFCDYIGCDNKYEVENALYDDYIKYCINEYISEHSNEEIKYMTCVKCNRKLPLDKNFFPPDDRVADGYTHRCKMCKPSVFPIVCNDNYIRNIYKAFGNDGFKAYKQNIIEFYNTYCHKNNFEFRDNIENKYKIIKYYYENGYISNEQLNKDYIMSNFNFKFYETNNEISEFISDNNCKIRPWLYPCYYIGDLTFEQGKELLTRYINEQNIIIDNIFEFNEYEKILKSACLGQFTRNDWTSLEFVVKYYDNKYAGYKFKLKSTNYYKKKENRIFDMKWLVEKDLKIEILKIPLYITKTMLHEHYSPLYLILNRNCYDGSLFKWINECYPDKFIELDFNINPYRNLFDSFEEAQVDRILRTDCSNVIYNIRNSDNEITVLGIKPDWVILSKKGTIFVEYFGLYANGGKEYKERLEIYKNKMDIKYTKYNELLKMGYKHLYIYPDDLKNDFQGIHKKLKSMV